MLRQIQEGLLKKSLKIKKAPSIQGSVCVHFPNPEVKDIILYDFESVDVFQRINISTADIKASNIEALVKKGILVVG